MLLNGASIRAAQTGFRLVFDESLASTMPAGLDLAMEVESSGQSEEYHFGDFLPQLREWIGERQVQNLRDTPMTLRNKTWELTVGITREAFEDDRLGVYRPQIQSMAVQARLHVEKLLIDLLTAGFTTGKSYDGVAFFAATHPTESASTLSNLVAGALATATYREALQKLRQMKSWRNEPLDVMAYGKGKPTLYVGPSNEATARSILLAEYGSNGSSNTDFGTAELKVLNRLTGTHWFLGVTGGPLRPLISQMRRRPTFVAFDQVDDAVVWTKNEVQYGVDGRWNAGYALWQLMIGSLGA